MNTITSKTFLSGILTRGRFVRFSAAVLALGLAQQANAQFAADYTFDTNLLATVTGADAGKLTANPFNLNGNGFRSNSWDPSNPGLGAVIISGANTPSTSAASLAGAVYWDFTLAANQGELLNLNTLTLLIGVNGLASESHFMVQSSIEGFGSDKPTLNLVPSSVSTPNANTVFRTATINLGSLYDNVSEATFRVYMYTTADSASQYSRLSNISVNGTVTAVPEPAEISAVLALGAIGVSLVLRRRRNRAA